MELACLAPKITSLKFLNTVSFIRVFTVLSKIDKNHV